MNSESTSSAEQAIARQVTRACAGDTDALATIFDHYRPRLLRMVQVRLDPRIRSRVDPSDVLQETYIDVAKEVSQFDPQGSLPFFVWLRGMTTRRLMNTHRFHVHTTKRSVSHEISLHTGRLSYATSASIAAQLVGRFTSASKAVRRLEAQVKVEETLNQMDAIDREILTLRHLEELSNSEVSHVLEISKTAASNRYIRALARISDRLSEYSESPSRD